MEQRCQQYGPGIGPVEQLNGEQRRLVEQLLDYRTQREKSRDAGKSQAAYSCAEDFLLQHGVWYQPDAWLAQYEMGLPKMCFGNSIARAYRYGYQYVEGYAIHSTLPIAVLHAWNMRSHYAMHDSTWCNQGSAYLGVQFSAGRADDASWDGDACVLDDSYRGFPLFQQRWNGEDFSRVWPESDIIRMLRARGARVFKAAEEALNAR